MTKTFCDKCGVECSESEQFTSLTTSIKSGDNTLAIIALVQHRMKDGMADLCKGCVFDAIAALDDRPKQKQIVKGEPPSINPREPHDFAEQSHSGYCKICGCVESSRIHQNLPDVVNIPALFGGSVKE